MAVDVKNPSINGSAVSPPSATSSQGGSVTVSSPGAAGRSAYDLAVAEGFVGTLDEWLESLEGEPGEQGPPGPVGEPDVPTLTLIFENGLI